MQRSALLVSVVSVVLGGLAIAGIVWWALWLVLGAKADTPNQLDLTKIALSVSAGVGAAVALVVAYRKQRDDERGRFAQLFGAAAAQLGSADVAVRIAGAYAMAGVADEFSTGGRRQQCIDVLCGYLRLPYDPSDGGTHLISRKEKVDAAGTEVERLYQLRQNDREVRRTIVAVIASRLRRQAEISWSTYNFNFDDAVLEDVNFRGARFVGKHTHFRGTRFTGSRSADFTEAEFTGQHVTFHAATFDSDAVFRKARFVTTAHSDHSSRAGTSFVDAVFNRRADFRKAEFAGPETRFTRARFAGKLTSFTGAHFAADTTTFRDTHFACDRTYFDDVHFVGERTSFDDTVIGGSRITFTNTRFDATRTVFDNARIGSEHGSVHADFRGVTCRGSVSTEGAAIPGCPFGLAAPEETPAPGDARDTDGAGPVVAGQPDA